MNFLHFCFSFYELAGQGLCMVPVQRGDLHCSNASCGIATWGEAEVVTSPTMLVEAYDGMTTE